MNQYEPEKANEGQNLNNNPILNDLKSKKVEQFHKKCKQ